MSFRRPYGVNSLAGKILSLLHILSALPFLHSPRRIQSDLALPAPRPPANGMVYAGANLGHGRGIGFPRSIHDHGLIIGP